MQETQPSGFACAYHFIYTRDIPNIVTGTKADQYTGGINFLFYSAKDISGVTRAVSWVFQHYRIKQCYFPSPSVYYKCQKKMYAILFYF